MTTLSDNQKRAIEECLNKGHSPRKIGLSLGIAPADVRSYLKTSGIIKVEWSDEDLASLRAIFPNHSSWAVAKMLNHSYEAVKHKAYELGLNKSDEYLATCRRHGHYGTKPDCMAKYCGGETGWAWLQKTYTAYNN